MHEYHKRDISDVALEFGTDVNVGRINIDSKRKRSSKNDIFRIPPVDAGRIVRKIASDASLILLAITYVIAAIIGYHIEALVAVPFLIIAFALSCYFSYFAEKQISQARSMLVPKVKIIENGNKIHLSALDIEVGDLLYFSRGDIIPADARLVSSERLYVAERFYNKINEKVEYKRLVKNHDALYIEDNAAENYDNMIYAGSAVISGNGRAIVTSIGSSTRVGRTERVISLVSDRDSADFMSSFGKFAKRFSLAVLIALVPFSIISIYLRTLNASLDLQSSILYDFLIMLAVAVTSMSELIASPSLMILSHSLFSGKNSKDRGITKLSSVENIADADTLLILCGETLVDKRNLVRRVFISDKEYRFDSLKSKELDSFLLAIDTYISKNNKSTDAIERKIIKTFASNRDKSPNSFDAPMPRLIKSDSVGDIDKCRYFRTEHGSRWSFSDESAQRFLNTYNNYIELGLKVYIYISIDEDNEPVFEGMIAIGEEYAFAQSDLFSEYIENGITPVLVLHTENDDSIRLALNCGMVDNIDDIAIASRLAEEGKMISDMPVNTRAYVGFGREGVKDIVNSLSAKGRKVLPVIKDLTEKNAILPTTVYATQDKASFESVKYTSSMILSHADSEKRDGGLLDALRIIKSARISRNKVNAFKRYLTFSTVFRLSAVVLSLLFRSACEPISPLMILLAGVLSDGVALLTIITQKGCSKTGIANPPIIAYAVAGALLACMLNLATNILFGMGFIDVSNSQIFELYSAILAQFAALGAIAHAFRKLDTNFTYILIVASYSIYLVLQNWFPDSVFALLDSLSYARTDLRTLIFVIILGALSVASILMIDKLFSNKKSQS